jgi:lipopolysaccharide/colanic/teichoic acid biosynthesis glycosyltransferase
MIFEFNTNPSECTRPSNLFSKRLFDLLFTLPGLLLLSPLFAAITIWIKLDSTGPVFFRQERVGRFGKLFRIFKFRTMCLDAEAKGRQITVGEDSRITHSGKFLRHYKLDELPQLLNVVLGEMSLVGPRPEVPRYVALYPVNVREQVLSVPPGITDYASIEYKDENAILGRSADPDRTYIEEVMPVKLAFYARYVSERTLWIDFILILRTLKAIIT